MARRSMAAMELQILKTAVKAVGIKQTRKAIRQGSAKVVFVARDADKKILDEIEELCANAGIKVVYVETKRSLGKACGIEVGAAAAVITIHS